MKVKKELYLIATRLAGAPEKSFSALLYDPNEDDEGIEETFLFVARSEHDADVIYEAWKNERRIVIEGDAAQAPLKGVSIFVETSSVELGRKIDEDDEEEGV